jgi:hypothetical protein
VSHVTQARRRRKKRILVAAASTGPGQSVDARNATNRCATGTRWSHELPWLCRFLAGLSPVSSIDASDVIGRRLKNGAGQLGGL